MRKSVTAAVICFATAVLVLAVQGLAAAAKPELTGFASMASSIEKSYGTVFELELTLRNDKPVYKADVVVDGKRVVVYLDAATGKEIERKKAASLDEEERAIYSRYNIKSSSSGSYVNSQAASGSSAQTQAGSSAGAGISYEKARGIAIAKVGGGTVREIDLDRENGRLVYEAEVKYNGRKYELKIDAATGEILKYKIDD